MFYQDIKKAINHYVETIKGPTKITGYRLNTILNDIYDYITNVSWISQTITNGVTDKSPSEDAVFDALALKVDISSLPLRYKALLSQNAPVASTNNDTMVAGQIWELSGAAHPSDYSTIDTFELISGTLYAAGSKYRVSVDTLFTLSASAMEYDGSPYVVSTDVNDDFAPFVNTTVEIPIFSFVSDCKVRVASPNNLYNKNKTFIMVGQRGNDSIKIDVDDIVGSSIDIVTTDTTVKVNNILYYTPIEIEVYP